MSNQGPGTGKPGGGTTYRLKRDGASFVESECTADEPF
jgi:hypothetical protein